jgi:hypothetical protein
VVVRWSRTEISLSDDLCRGARATLQEPVAATPGYVVEEIAAREVSWNGTRSCELEFYVGGPLARTEDDSTEAFHYVGRFVSQAYGYLWIGHGNPLGPAAVAGGRKVVDSTRPEFEAFASGVTLEPATGW